MESIARNLLQGVLSQGGLLQGGLLQGGLSQGVSRKESLARSLLQGVSCEGGEKNYHNTVRFIILYPMLSQNKSK